MPSGIYQHELPSEETRRKMSISQLGRRHSIETRIKMSKNHKGNKNPMYGKILSKETREKISEANKGRKFSEEHKRKIGLVKRGNKYFMGHKHSEETKRKLRKAHKEGKWNEARKKISIKAKIYYSNPNQRERLRKLALIGRIKQQTMKEPTSIEQKVYNELKNRGFLFETQKVVNGRFIVDAYIPSLNLVIEADGNYWHSLEKTVKKDKAENAYLTKCGYDLLRLSETEINNNNFRGELALKVQTIETEHAMNRR